MNTNKHIIASYIPVRKISDYRYTFPGQIREQNAFFELDTQTGISNAMHNQEIGNAIPFSVYHGIDRRYSFNPYLKMRTVNDLGKKLLPLFQRVINGTSIAWDGSNNIAILSDDALAAEAEIRDLIEATEYETFKH